MANNLNFMSTAGYNTTTPWQGSASLNGGFAITPAGAMGAATQNWCWECRFKRASAPGSLEVIMGAGENSNNAGYLGMDSSGRIVGNISSGNTTITGTTNFADGAWHHVAMAAGASGFKVYVDGAQQATSAATQVIAVNCIFTVRNLQSGGGYLFGGDIDEVALWGFARYTGAFTPSSYAYSGSEGMLVLYHLDGNGNDSVNAAGYSLVGPPAGTTGSASATFTVAANAALTVSTTITPSSGGGGGTFIPATVTLAPAGTATFTYTAASSGTKTISTTNNKSLTDPPSIAYVASGGAPAVATMFTLAFSPGSGTVNTATTLTATPDNNWPSGGAITLAMSGAAATVVNGTGGTLSGTGPYTWTPTSGGTTAATLTITPTGTGTVTATATNSYSPVLSNPAAATYTSSAVVGGPGNISPNDPNIIYSPGVWDVTSARAKTINSGAYFYTTVAGSASAITLNFDVTNVSAPAAQVKVYVDGALQVSQAVTATIALTLPTSNTWTKHLIRVAMKSSSELVNRWNAPQNTAIVFTGITTTPNTCTTVAGQQAPLKGLVLGDSITEGVRALNSSAGNDTDRNDGTFGWAYHLGAELGAEIGVIGFGSTGWYTAGSGGVPAIQTSYASLWSGTARTFAGLDFIVINQGTNEGANDTTTYVTSTFNSLLAAAPAGCQLFAMRPLNGTAQASYLRNGIAACSNPARVTYIDTAGWWDPADASDSLHPYGYASMNGIAQLLAAAVRTKLRGVANRWAKT